MPVVHFLNVSPGDCTIIQHGSGHVSMIDICDGNLDEETQKSFSAASRSGLLSMVEDNRLLAAAGGGDFKMRFNLTNPIRYAKSLGIESLFRFILTHPDMDHMDGLNALAKAISIANFWDAGLQREKPDFSGGGYKEEDWDRYIKLRSGDGVKALKYLAGSRFKYANKNDDDTGGGDGLYILAPDTVLVAAAAADEDPNDASYVLLYRSTGGRVLLAGDAHDDSMEYVLANYESDVANCSVMIAPHHGRDSGRLYEFLDRIEPKLTLIGNTPSEHIDYGQWTSRNLPFITSNQAGNIVLQTSDGYIDVYVENVSFAKASGKDCSIKNSQGYIFFDRINATAEVKGQKSNASSLTSSSSVSQNNKNIR